jgi:hypothetical protein
LRKLLHLFKLRVAATAAFTLLFAQLGAFSHAYSHDTAAGAGSSSHRTAVVSHDLCNECLAYAPLLCAASSPAAMPWIESQGRGLPPRSTLDSPLHLDRALAFRSRAPPPTL